MYPQNLHTHGTMCDGKNDYEDTVLRAIELGLTSIGFSEHSYMPYSPSGGMSLQTTEAYKVEINRLKVKYANIIDVFCGLEFDMYSPDPLVGFDYVIGSVHYLKKGDILIPFDRPLNVVKTAIAEHYDGDSLKFAREYYEQIALLPKYARQVDIVGHFDLITKNNDLAPVIDVDDKRYQEYAIEAVRSLCKSVGVFEINTGAISRGYRTTPYPAPFILKEIKRAGGEITISSDCHDNQYLTYYFDEGALLAKECGFDHAVVLTKEGFRPVKL